LGLSTPAKLLPTVRLHSGYLYLIILSLFNFMFSCSFHFFW
jgi:hypothetical protein